MSIANPYFHGDKKANAADSLLKRKAATASLGIALLLVTFKFTAFLSTNAVSLLSSLMDSAFDALASLIVLLSVTHAATPADADHRFGHGKIEAFGALAQSLFITGSSLFLLAESVHRFILPQKITDPTIGIGVMFLSIVMTAGLIIFQQRVIKKTGSIAIAADYMHYKGDILMNLAVLFALGLGYYTGWPFFDPLFGLLIALKLLYSAWDIGLQSFDVLLDKELPDADREKVIALVTNHPEVKGLHDLRSRSTGERYIISFHVEFDRQASITHVHDIMDDLERIIFEAFPKSEVFIHPEPEGLNDHRIDHMINKN